MIWTIAGCAHMVVHPLYECGSGVLAYEEEGLDLINTTPYQLSARRWICDSELGNGRRNGSSGRGLHSPGHDCCKLALEHRSVVIFLDSLHWIDHVKVDPLTHRVAQFAKTSTSYE
jgi:hypothetical protein